MRQTGVGVQLNQQERLFLGLVEQLTRPLLAISHLSEVATMSEDWQTVRVLANSSLRLAEGYALSLRVHGKVAPLQLEPVTVSALLYDAAEGIEPFAQRYGVSVELNTGPRVQPVVADRQVLQSAFESLGQVFVLAQAESETPGSVYLMAHRSRHGAVAGLYSGSMQLGVESLRRARAVQGRAHQPLQQFVDGPAAGVFVAESLLGTLSARLHVARYHNLSGLATTLQPSQQLQLI
ncbi:MAG TPA: hypothetical protein VMB52_01115 [Verrucomicrobiae bacterium]|nr:hypothetical protein [Verrucomicrobiae bacterium]